MKIEKIGMYNTLNVYSSPKKGLDENIKKKSSDTAVFSQEGKSMSAISNEVGFDNNDNKIESIKNNLDNGTYSVEARAVAKRFIDIMKGRDI
jgi:negative regulator of flagellin synthesis FlgM